MSQRLLDKAEAAQTLKTKLCVRCKKNKDLSAFAGHKDTKDRLRSWCKRCHRENERRRYDYAKANKQCTWGRCNLDPVGASLACAYHFFYCALHRMAKDAKGSAFSMSVEKWRAMDKFGKRDLVQKLTDKYNSNPYCPVTGEKLICGINLNIDHIIPKSKRPDLAFDPDNLQLVSKTYNQAKNNLYDSEFARRYNLKAIDPDWAVKLKEELDSLHESLDDR